MPARACACHCRNVGNRCTSSTVGFAAEVAPTVAVRTEMALGCGEFGISDHTQQKAPSYRADCGGET